MPTIAYQGPTELISAAIVTGAGASFEVNRRIDGDSQRVFQAKGTTSAGAGAATVLVQVSCNNSDWITLGTITLTLGTVSTSDGLASSASWPYVRGNITAISGTTATVTLYMGV
jgi:hypothetical protein